jgi:hypothetical protein
VSLAGLDGRQAGSGALAGAIGDAVQLAVGADRLQGLVGTRQDREVRPIGRAVEGPEAFDLVQGELCLEVAIARHPK